MKIEYTNSKVGPTRRTEYPPLSATQVAEMCSVQGTCFFEHQGNGNASVYTIATTKRVCPVCGIIQNTPKAADAHFRACFTKWTGKWQTKECQLGKGAGERLIIKKDKCKYARPLTNEEYKISCRVPKLAAGGIGNTFVQVRYMNNTHKEICCCGQTWNCQDLAEHTESCEYVASVLAEAREGRAAPVENKRLQPRLRLNSAPRASRAASGDAHNIPKEYFGSYCLAGGEDRPGLSDAAGEYLQPRNAVPGGRSANLETIDGSDPTESWVVRFPDRDKDKMALNCMNGIVQVFNENKSEIIRMIKSKDDAIEAEKEFWGASEVTSGRYRLAIYDVDMQRGGGKKGDAEVCRTGCWEAITERFGIKHNWSKIVVSHARRLSSLDVGDLHATGVYELILDRRRNSEQLQLSSVNSTDRFTMMLSNCMETTTILRSSIEQLPLTRLEALAECLQKQVGISPRLVKAITEVAPDSELGHMIETGCGELFAAAACHNSSFVEDAPTGTYARIPSGLMHMEPGTNDDSMMRIVLAWSGMRAGRVGMSYRGNRCVTKLALAVEILAELWTGGGSKSTILQLRKDMLRFLKRVIDGSAEHRIASGSEHSGNDEVVGRMISDLKTSSIKKTFDGRVDFYAEQWHLFDGFAVAPHSKRVKDGLQGVVIDPHTDFQQIPVDTIVAVDVKNDGHFYEGTVCLTGKTAKGRHAVQVRKMEKEIVLLANQLERYDWFVAGSAQANRPMDGEDRIIGQWLAVRWTDDGTHNCQVTKSLDWNGVRYHYLEYTGGDRFWCKLKEENYSLVVPIDYSTKECSTTIDV